MNADFKLLLYKFAASKIRTDDSLQQCGENIFKIQEIFSEYPKIEDASDAFNPIIFFATYIDDILKLENICIEYNKNGIIPSVIKLDDLTLIASGCRLNNLHSTQLFIREYKQFDANKMSEPSVFRHYYSQYFEEIDIKYPNLKLSNTERAALFYIEYGYWHNLKMNYVNPYQFTCSYPEFITEDLDEQTALKQYFDSCKVKDVKLSFDPYVYVASNYDSLKYLLGDFDYDYKTEVRICKQYIRHGYSKKMSINSFNTYSYLANNYKEIKKILNGNWDRVQLTKRNVAIHFLKKNGSQSVGTFNATQFVEENVSNNNVNFDKKLSIENAPVYFVENYIKSKQVRFHTTGRYRSGVFISQRIKDSLRSLPLSISKCFFSMPL